MISAKILKKLTSPLGLLVILFFFLTPFLSPNFYETHDGEAQVARFASYFTAFQDGQFPPRWAGNLNYGYGYTVFLFYYPLPGYISSALHSFGISFENTFKIIIGLSFIFSSLFFYKWAQLFTKNEVAFMGALIYGLAPYHFLNLYVRGDIAEMLALVFVPLVLICIEKLKLNLNYVIYGGMAYALLVLSHNGISLMFSPVLLLYGIIRLKSKKEIKYLFGLFFGGILLSAFFWLPALYESRYTNTAFFIGEMYKEHFPSLMQIIYSPWGFGPDVARPDGLSPQVGLFLIVFFIWGVVRLFRQKKKDLLLIYWIFVFLIAACVALPISTPLWNSIGLLKLYEFPWRFIALATFASSAIVVLVLSDFKIKNKKIIFLLTFLCITFSFNFLKTNSIASRSDSYYLSYKDTTVFHGEGSPIWTAGNAWKSPKFSVEVIAGEAEIKDIKRKSHLHNYKVEAKSDSVILDNTFYFPGWIVEVDGKQIPIQFQDANHRGLITFQVPKGKHDVEVKFTESKVRLISDWISASAWIGAIGMLTFIRLGKKKIKNR